MNVPVEDILKEFGLRPEREPEWYKVICPFHNDTAPSGRIHHKSGVFKCWVCTKITSLALYLSKQSNLPLFQVKRKMGFRSDCKNPISATEVEADHIRIWGHPLFLHELHQRCVTDEMIRKYRLGVKDYGVDKRISIPIQNEIGEYANLRLYIPGASEYKFLNLSGNDRSRIRFFPIEQLEYDQILVCGGEIKAIAAAEILNSVGIGAVSPTCGENVWPNELTYLLDNKLVWVNNDVDETGVRYSEYRCRTINTHARELHKVTFTPEEVGGLEKGDLNDFLRLGGDLYQKLLSSPEWKFVPGGEMVNEPPNAVSFREAYSHKNVGKKVQFVGTVAGVLPKSYSIASEVEVKCPRDKDYCQVCDVNSKALTNETIMTIEPEHAAILGLVAEKLEKHPYIYKDCFRIPPQCRECFFKPVAYHNVKEIRLDEQLELTSRIEPITNCIAYVVNSPDHLLDSESFTFDGRLYPSPKDQASSFLISNCEPIQDTLDSYQAMPAEYFKLFIPDGWTVESINKKMTEIYDDLEANVTRVWQRRDYHIAIDLTYHSILHFDFLSLNNINGWIECLAVGDTEQAKSRTFNSLREHYSLGKKIDCKNVSLPGLTIGLEKSGQGKYFYSLGAYPRNDRKLIGLEELGGMPQKIFQSLTEVRSAGYVEINKIEHKIRRARVRAFAMSNCIEGREVASYTFGIESALGVIGTHQDLRRFDFVIILAKADIKALPELVNPPTCEHRFSSELCQKLILKAWKCTRVNFEDSNHILEVSARLVEKFGEGLPILGAGSSHIKVAKLSASIAARTCSYDGETLIVRKCHSEYIEQYLTRIYTAPSSRLDQKSKSVRDSTKLRDQKGLIDYLKTITNVVDVMMKLEEADVITAEFLRNLCGDMYIGSTLFAKLIQSNAVVRIRAEKYAKTPEFTNLLRTVEFEMQAPDYVKKKGNF